MPIYEYGCPECSAVKEHIMSMSDTSRPICEVCHAVMGRLISAPAPHQIGGVAGKKRTQELVRKRNADHRKTSRYKDERVQGIESARRRGLPA